MSARFTWLGHSTFRVETPGGKVILIDPWVESNPACPDSEKEFDRIDYMLCTHGHSDHVGDAIALAKKYEPQVVGIFELCHYFEKKGVKNTTPINKGGSVQFDGITITMVNAFHSSSFFEEDGTVIYAGEPCGYVVALEDDEVFYHAGDTCLFGDMKLIAELYKPVVAMLPIGDRFVMSPREAAYAAQLLGCEDIIPMHHGTFPLLTGTVKDFRSLTKHLIGINVVDLDPGETFQLYGAEQGLG